MAKLDDKIEIESFTSPGQKKNVDRAKYQAMREALLSVLPAQEPGFTYDEMKAALLPLLPQGMWPGGEKVGWWLMAVQLDLEAKGLIHRIVVKPLRFVKSMSDVC